MCTERSTAAIPCTVYFQLMKVIVFLPFTLKSPSFFLPPWGEWGWQGGRNNLSQSLPRWQLGSLVHQQCLTCMRPSHADLDGAWKTPFLCFPLGEVCCNLTLFPGEHICALQRLHLTLLWAKPCEGQMFVELGFATLRSPLKTALWRTFSRHVCRGLHCCYSVHAEE